MIPKTHLKEKITCKRCVMDNTAANFEVDDTGICNYCKNYNQNYLSVSKNYTKSNLEKLIKKIKVNARDKKYDCIVGLSGGLDSSWTLVQVKKLGLRPLAVHMDNGWNSETAQNNIFELVRILDVDLYTHVIDWIEYRKLMEAFFKANVIDIELLMDNAMRAVNWNMAEKFNVKYILSGTNTASEGMSIPPNWNWPNKTDLKNIKYIGHKFSKIKLKTFPGLSTKRYISLLIRGFRWIPFLDYTSYTRSEAIELLSSKYNYKSYEHKHYESVFTRFYQGYILPKKFHVDKRKLHYSALIMSNQITRKDAAEQLKLSTYSDQLLLNSDIKYFLKKMKWSNNDLKNYLNTRPISHWNYKNEKLSYILLKLTKKILNI